MSAIYKRDLRAYFTSPVGYVFIAAFLFVMNLVFFLMNMLTGENRLTTCYTVMLYAMMILVPILTMRTFSEDYKQKTDQLLLTSPVRPVGIVMGKFLAAYTVFVITLSVLLINQAGNDVFAAVILHPAETQVPVQPARCRFPRFQGPVRQMEDLSIPDPGVQHPDVLQFAPVSRLSSPLGEEGGAVQDHGPAVSLFPAVQHPGGKLPKVAVLLIEFRRHAPVSRFPAQTAAAASISARSCRKRATAGGAIFGNQSSISPGEMKRASTTSSGWSRSAGSFSGHR